MLDIAYGHWSCFWHSIIKIYGQITQNIWPYWHIIFKIIYNIVYSCIQCSIQYSLLDCIQYGMFESSPKTFTQELSLLLAWWHFLLVSAPFTLLSTILVWQFFPVSANRYVAIINSRATFRYWSHRACSLCFLPIVQEVGYWTEKVQSSTCSPVSYRLWVQNILHMYVTTSHILAYTT